MNDKPIALVVAAYGRRGQLETAGGDRRPYLVKRRRHRVVCGDRVRWDPLPEDGGTVVTGIETRDNSLERLDPGRGTTETLAANLDRLAVVVAPLPKPDWFLVDRFLCAAAAMGAGALLIANKTDLAGSADENYVAELKNYRGLGYPTLAISAESGAGIDSLREALAGHTGILVGQSGVGKSSLINSLIPDADLATDSLTRSSDEGRHTTTASMLHRIPGGGRLIDSPGVRDFLPAIRAGASIQAGFPEILATSAECRFADCRHLREPACAVKAAVDAGNISPRRYESYRRLLRSAAEHWSD